MEPFINEDHGRPGEPKGTSGRHGLKDLYKGRGSFRTPHMSIATFGDLGDLGQRLVLR